MFPLGDVNPWISVKGKLKLEPSPITKRGMMAQMAMQKTLN